MNTQKVSVGLTTQVGYPVSLAGFLLAIYAYIQGDHTAGTVGAIVAGVAFGITQVFRYVQAVVLAKQKPAPSIVGGTTASGGFTVPASAFPTGAPAGTLPSRRTPVEDVQAPTPDTPESVAAEEAGLPSDDEELQNVPRQESAAVPEPPAGEPPNGQGETPVLEPGDYEEG